MEGAAAAEEEEGVTRFDAHGTAPLPPHKMLAAYLLRLGLDPARFAGPLRRPAPGAPLAEESPTEALHLLHRAHVCAIPFRSFPLGPGEGSLDISRVYRSLVQDRKGGTSFESNVMFAWALERLLGCQVDFLEASLGPGSKSSSAPSISHVCLLVHLEGQAWLADAAGGGLSVLFSGERFPGAPVEPLLFEAGLEQVQDSGHFRISRRGEDSAGGDPPHGLPTDPETTPRADPSSPASSSGGQAGRGAVVGPGVHGGQAAAEGHRAEEPSEREEWVLQAAASRVAPMADPGSTAGPPPSDAREAEPWEYPECSPAPARDPQAYPGDSEEDRERRSPAAHPGPAPEPPWVDLFCFSLWPRGLRHLEKAHLASLEGSERVAWRRRAGEEGGGRAVLLPTEYLVVQVDGTVQEHEAVTSSARFFEILESALGIRVPSSQQRPLPVPRDLSSGRLAAAGAPAASPWQAPGEAGSRMVPPEGEQEVLLRQAEGEEGEAPTELDHSGTEGDVGNSSGGVKVPGGSCSGEGDLEENAPQAASSSTSSLSVSSPVESTVSWFSYFNPWA